MNKVVGVYILSGYTEIQFAVVFLVKIIQYDIRIPGFKAEVKHKLHFRMTKAFRAIINLRCIFSKK